MRSSFTSIRQSVLPINIDFNIQAIQRYSYVAIAVTLILASIYLYLIVTIDNTNVGTTNGLWKSPAVATWEQGKEGEIDSGEVLYYKAYGYLAHLIPDDLVGYGTRFPFLTFRKMALLNGVFGAIASGFVCLLALGFSGSRRVAAIAVLAHAGAGFVLLNSINSEDIIPAYAFFVGSTVCFFAFLQLGKLWLGTLSCGMLALAMLFHWTLMVPGLAAYGAVFLLLAVRKRSNLLLGIAWLGVFLVLTQALVLLFYPSRHIPIWAVALPAKTSDVGGWVGFHAEKLVYLFIGVGNYFTGAGNVSNYQLAFHGRSLHYMIYSWIYAVLAMSGCLVALFSKRSSVGVRSLAVFGTVLLLAGEAGAVYSQPADPQMQIQPLFATIVGVILLARWWSQSDTPGVVMSVVCIAVLMLNGLYNIRVMEATRGADSQSVRIAQDLGDLFPKDTTTIVCVGFEGWLTWDYIVIWKGNGPGFLANFVGLATPFTKFKGISGADAAAAVRRKIDRAMANGKRVVAAALWTQAPQTLVPVLASVADQSEARVFESTLRISYGTGQTWNTPVGPFVELLPKAFAK
jgi:hypothetical protein